MRIYPKHEACGFRLTRAAWGAFSNFQPLAVPIATGPWTFATSEHVYQAAKFGAHPDVQRRIAEAPTPREAAAIGRTPGLGIDPGWNTQRVDVMRWVLRMKREANQAEIDAVLAATGDRPIVEVSTRDPWWGARPVADRYDVVRRRRLTPWNRSESRPYHADRRLIHALNNTKHWLAPGAAVVTDGLGCWSALEEAACSHRAIRTGSGRQAARMASFKWVNTTLGNIKSAITGTYRKLGPDHAGRYLASFAWRYNRRYQLQTMIPRFVHSAARTQPMPYRLLIAG